MATNKKLGNTFEQELCELLFDMGFWTHNLAQNESGQPADVIAARNGKAYLIDCKVCSNRKFPLSRMESNQDLSMSLWKECGNGEGWFALKIDGVIVMLPHVLVQAGSKVQSAFTADEIFEYGLLLERWVERCK